MWRHSERLYGELVTPQESVLEARDSGCPRTCSASGTDAHT